MLLIYVIWNIYLTAILIVIWFGNEADFTIPLFIHLKFNLYALHSEHQWPRIIYVQHACSIDFLWKLLTNCTYCTVPCNGTRSHNLYNCRNRKTWKKKLIFRYIYGHTCMYTPFDIRWGFTDAISKLNILQSFWFMFFVQLSYAHEHRFK